MFRRKRKNERDLLEMSERERADLAREIRERLRERPIESKLRRLLLEAETLTVNGTVVYDENQLLCDFHVTGTRSESHPYFPTNADRRNDHIRLKRLKITSLDLSPDSSEPNSSSPSPDKAKQQISDGLDDSEISWISEFLDHKGEKFTDRMWSLSQKDFVVLENLCKESLRIARKNIMKEMRPYTPTDELLKTIEGFG